MSVQAETGAQADQRSLDATGQEFVDNIKAECYRLYPTNLNLYKTCAQSRYDAMTAFLGKLFKNRDAYGIDSWQFQRGVDCLTSASPRVVGQESKFDAERADWFKAKACYEKAVQ